jgi:putative exosortase-associated protein (TIGR04073 family)
MRPKKSICIFILSTLILSILTPYCFAGDPFRKLARGATNVSTGWLEVFKQIGVETKTNGNFSGIFVGPFKGLFKAIGRTAAGLYDVMTFIIPVPADFEPLIEPEFVFYED